MPNESLALRIFAFFGVSLSIVFAYYQVPFHAESFANYKWYIVSILTIYGIYKFFKVSLSGDATRYSILEMIGYALLHIVVLCGMFFYLSNPDHSTNGSGTLFFSILGYLFLPTIIVVISASFGKKILSLIKKDLKLTNSFIVLFSLGLGLA
jgi:hypothetical protein